MDVGAAYLDVAASASKSRHLWLVCTCPNRDDEVVIVSVMSLRAEVQDRSCTLSAGDHPFIQHESVVFYRKARLMTTRDLSIQVEQGRFVSREQASGAVMERVRNGAIESQFTPRHVKRAVEDCSWRREV